MERPPKWKELREPHTHTYKTGKVVVGVLLVWLDKNESDRSRVRWVRLSLSLSLNVALTQLTQEETKKKGPTFSWQGNMNPDFPRLNEDMLE